jgi:hypothetical protein
MQINPKVKMFPQYIRQRYGREYSSIGCLDSFPLLHSIATKQTKCIRIILLKAKQSEHRSDKVKAMQKKYINFNKWFFRVHFLN